MAWAGIEQRSRNNRRTIDPTDVLVFALLAWAFAAGSNAKAGDEISMVILTIAWLSAAVTRMAEFRRGDRPAVQLKSLNLRTGAMLVAGTGPWLLLGFLQNAYPTSAMWQPIDIDPSLKALGISLAIAVIAEPFINARGSASDAQPSRSGGHIGIDYRFSGSMVIRSGAILLLSGSPVFALLSAVWLGVALCQPAAPVSDAPQLEILPLASTSS
jgi:hypothetical protein